MITCTDKYWYVVPQYFFRNLGFRTPTASSKYWEAVWRNEHSLLKIRMLALWDFI